MVEGLVWLKAMKSKKIIFTSEIFRIYNRDEEDELSLMNQGNNILQGCLGKAYYCNEELANFKNSYFLFILYFLRAASKFNRYSHHANISFRTRLNMQKNILTSLLVFFTYPIGYLVALMDKKGAHI